MSFFLGFQKILAISGINKYVSELYLIPFPFASLHPTLDWYDGKINNYNWSTEGDAYLLGLNPQLTNLNACFQQRPG